MKKTNTSNINAGHYLSETQYYKVGSNMGGRVKVVNERGFEFGVGEKIVEEGMYSAHQFTEEKKVTRTELCEILTFAWGSVFTVKFKKLAKMKDLNEAITEAYEGNADLTLAKAKKSIKTAFAGSDRTLIGYLVKAEVVFGRSMCIDLEKERKEGEHDNRTVTVDHRSVYELIFRNVKYTLK